jgi:hemolysin activation/secretion protein
MKFLHYSVSVFVVIISVTTLSAVPFTDTGSIYNQLKTNQIEKERNNITTKSKIKEKKVSEENNLPTFYIKEIIVLDNIDLSEEKTKSILQPYENRYLTMEELKNAAKSLEDAHLANGDLSVNVIIGDIHDGKVTFRLRGGVLREGGLYIENNSTHIKDKLVDGLLKGILKPGLITREQYERAILLTNDVAGISAKADFYLSDEEGKDDLVITINDEDGFNGNIDIDNFGSYYTGRTQFATTLYWNSPNKYGEEIVTRLITTGKYSNYGYIDVALPVLNNGTRVGISFDYLDYELNHQKNNESGKGNAWNTTLYIKYPFVRTENLTISGEIDYTHSRSKDYNSSAELDNSQIDKGIIRLSGNRSDEFLLNGITYFNISLTIGNLKLKNEEHRKSDALFSQTAGYYTKANISLSRLQNVVDDFSMKLSIDGQWASKNLDTSEKYSLGGPYSVAGYPVGQVSGDNGALFYIDLRYDFYNMPWGGDFQVKTYYTYGWTQIFKDPSAWFEVPQYADNNEVRLQTAGIGLSQTWDNSTVVRLLVGKQVGENVLRQYYDGKDYDQSDSDYRAWLEAIYYF